jgi:hypothetical protein
MHLRQHFASTLALWDGTSALSEGCAAADANLVVDVVARAALRALLGLAERPEQADHDDLLCILKSGMSYPNKPIPRLCSP